MKEIINLVPSGRQAVKFDFFYKPYSYEVNTARSMTFGPDEIEQELIDDLEKLERRLRDRQTRRDAEEDESGTSEDEETGTTHHRCH